MEGNDYENCYEDSFYLSDKAFLSKFSLSKMPMLFGNKTIVQWGMFAKPRHFIFQTLLKNIVEVVKSLYFRKPVIFKNLLDTKFQTVVCATGPRMITATLRDLMYEEDLHKSSNYSVRIVNKDFQVYGGEYKVQGFIPYSKHHYQYKHFSTFMKRHQISLLKSYNE